MANNPEVDKYIDNAAEFAQPILKHLRSLMHEVCPDVEEKMKWGMPCFDYRGPLSNMAAFKAHAIFGFPKSSLLEDPVGIFANEDQAMSNMGRLTSLSDLPSDEILKEYIQRAIQLNLDGKKVTRKQHTKDELIIPEDFQKLLGANEEVKQKFEVMSYSHRKEYIEWITEAKRPKTRERRLLQAVEMIGESKSRNWKYDPSRLPENRQTGTSG